MFFKNIICVFEFKYLVVLKNLKEILCYFVVMNVKWEFCFMLYVRKDNN